MVGKGITPLWRHRQREQFARAVDAHPGPADGVPDDPGDLADELAVVALLRKAAVTSGPDEAARARMRARVLGAAAEPPPTKLDQLRRPERRSGARGRLAVALAAALCLLFSLTGMSLLLSRDALPGDPLYGVKRTAESASLGLTFDEESKGHKRLEFADARVGELETLVDRYRESGGGPLGGYLTALADFDADAAAGSRVLTAVGSNSDRRALEDLRDWATAHAARLSGLRPGLPAAAAERAGASLDLLARIAERATALRERMDCVTVTSGQVDQVGPVPAEGECATGAAVPGATPDSGQPLPPQPTTDAATPSATGEAPGTTAPPAGAPTTAQPTATAPAPTTTTTGPLLPLPTLTLPSLPLPGLGG